MLSIFSNVRDLTMLSVAVRLLLAFLCGGAIGLERAYRRRSAGFRTHILICLGAALTTLTSQYLYLEMGYYTDMARLGAQVVAGIGFIGAGSIIVTRKQRVKGLTTAAGLWTAAIIGLCLGGGFYEGGILATILVLMAEGFFSKVEYKLMNNNPEINLYVEYRGNHTLDQLLLYLHDNNIRVLNIQITRENESEHHNATAIFSLRLPRQMPSDLLTETLSAMEGVVKVRQL